MSNEKRREVEREKYEALHQSRGHDGFNFNHGEPTYPLLDREEFTEMLDLGSGSGAFARRFAELGKTVSAVDISETALKNPNYDHPNITTHCRSIDDLAGIKPHEVVTSYDCLEHLHPKMVPDALRHIARLTKKLCVLNIAHAPSIGRGVNGEELHLTVRRKEWWMEKLKRSFGPKYQVGRNGDFIIIRRRP
jgi:2-polyprenyl-3-methyl-5-hydroxy-6-metoxy-1,4-benzoquinol methylase